jgi:hypothetical protein
MYPTIRSSLCRDTATDYPFCSTLSVDYTSDFPIYRLSMLYPTIRSALCRDTATDHPLCFTQSTVVSLATLQLTIRSALPVDIQLCSTLSGDDTSDYLLYSTLLYSVCRYVRRWSRLGASRRSLLAASRRSRLAVSCLRSRRWVSRRS